MVQSICNRHIAVLNLCEVGQIICRNRPSIMVLNLCLLDQLVCRNRHNRDLTSRRNRGPYELYAQVSRHKILAYFETKMR